MSNRMKTCNELEIDDLSYRYYRDLRDEKVKIIGYGKYLVCPFCRDHRRREYHLWELKRHASHIATDSKSASFREKCRHYGLLKYLDWYTSVKGELGLLTNKSPNPSMIYREGITDHASEFGEINTESDEIGVSTQDTEGNSCEKISRQGIHSQSCTAMLPLSQKDGDELIVWPWMAVIANLPVERKDGKYVSESGRKLKEDWISQGYNPIKVHPLWDFQGHSGYAIVVFSKDWEGFKNAMAFEKAFEMDHHGKRDWYAMRHKGNKVYGWLARAEEYMSRGLIGRHLQKNGDLKTVSNIQKTEKTNNTKLLYKLNDELELKYNKCEEIKSNISRTEMFARKVLAQKELMVQNYNEEMKKMHGNAFNRIREISEEHERSTAQLETHRKELKLRETELRQRQQLNQNEKLKLHEAEAMIEMAIRQQKKADDKMLMLVEYQKKVKDRLHEKIIELEAKLDQKQALELQIEHLRGTVEVMKHMPHEGSKEENMKLASFEEELKEKEIELEDMESLNQALIVKERKTNDELQDARKELIDALKNKRPNVFVKRMGDLDGKVFYRAVQKKYAGEEALEKAMEICSLWEDHLRDPGWHPLKVIMIDGKHKEVLDDGDEKLKEIKTELGDEVYEAITTALMEMNEYNPSGRYPVQELWNSNLKRKASLREGIEQLVRLWKTARANRHRKLI